MPRLRPVPGDCGEARRPDTGPAAPERSAGRVPGSDSARLLDISAEKMVSVEQEQEWLRQLSLIYSGLILIGVYMVQPFLTTASLDLSARICVVAFSVAIPLPAALVVVNRQESFRGRQTKAVSVPITQVVVAQTSAFVGVVAGFWHILWIAGVAVLISGLAGVAVHSTGYARLERDQGPTPPADEPGS